MKMECTPKPWQDLSNAEPEIAALGSQLLFQTREHVGLAFIATLRRDGAPRLHPISVVLNGGHLYVMIPRGSPKCADLLQDGRYALQAFPPAVNIEGEEFYLSGRAFRVLDPQVRQKLMDETSVQADEQEILFELMLERAMYTKLENHGTPDEHPSHQKWTTSGSSSSERS